MQIQLDYTLLIIAFALAVLIVLEIIRLSNKKKLESKTHQTKKTWKCL
jgi:uncharacterized protein YoxC